MSAPALDHDDKRLLVEVRFDIRRVLAVIAGFIEGSEGDDGEEEEEEDDEFGS